MSPTGSHQSSSCTWYRTSPVRVGLPRPRAMHASPPYTLCFDSLIVFQPCRIPFLVLSCVLLPMPVRASPLGARLQASVFVNSEIKASSREILRQGREARWEPVGIGNKKARGIPFFSDHAVIERHQVVSCSLQATRCHEVCNSLDVGLVHCIRATCKGSRSRDRTGSIRPPCATADDLHCLKTHRKHSNSTSLRTKSKC